MGGYTSKGNRKEIATKIFQKYEGILEEEGYSVTVRGVFVEWMDKVMEHDRK